jgi:protoporphyrinogen IX oxidase
VTVGAYYEWFKALHVISVIAWMAGMLYLPRLYVYHADAAPGSDKSETFKIMERRLLKAITTPAMVASFIFGTLMLATPGVIDWSTGWIWAKIALIVAMTAMHGFLGKWRKDFEADRNTRPGKFYRMMNEVPTLLMIFVVILVIVKPF